MMRGMAQTQHTSARRTAAHGWGCALQLKAAAVRTSRQSRDALYGTNPVCARRTRLSLQGCTTAEDRTCTASSRLFRKGQPAGITSLRKPPARQAWNRTNSRHFDRFPELPAESPLDPYTYQTRTRMRIRGMNGDTRLVHWDHEHNRRQSICNAFLVPGRIIPRPGLHPC